MNHHPSVRRTLAELVAIGLWCVSLSAHALSCGGVVDRFFVQCANSHCSAAFRARDVTTPGACARRTVVEAVPADVAEVVLRRVSNELASGDYEITLLHRYYAELPVTAEELNRAFSALEHKAPRILVSRTAAGAGLDQLREDWTGRARRSVVELCAYWAIEFTLLAGGLYALYRTTTTFRQRLRDAPRRSVLGPVGLQVGLFVVAVLSLGAPTWPVLLGLVAPMVLGVFIFELGSYVWARRRQKVEHEF